MAFNEQTATAEAENGRGQTFPKITYSFTWVEYADNQTMVDSKDELSLDEQRKVRNDERKTKARTAALNVALDAAGIRKPNLKEDAIVRLRAVYSGLYAKRIAGGMAEAQAKSEARALASQILGEDWPAEDSK